MAGIDLSDYVEVSERIEKFYEKFPEGSLQSDWQTMQMDGDYFVVCTARAYRSQDDRLPGVGSAWEPFPGKTPYTKDSELMNAETSAWGRAIAALGFEVKRGIASANEVRARQGNDKPDDRPASDKQRKYVAQLFGSAGIPKEGQTELVTALCGGDKLTKTGASQIIEALKEGTLEELRQAAGLGTQTATTEAPADEDGLPSADVTGEGEDVKAEGVSF